MSDPFESEAFLNSEPPDGERVLAPLRAKLSFGRDTLDVGEVSLRRAQRVASHANYRFDTKSFAAPRQGHAGLDAMKRWVHPLIDDTSPELDGVLTEHSFTSEAGTRQYKLYRPKRYPVCQPPLIVMMHACAQSPEDFAAGTRMNLLAEEFGFLVAYPVQSKSANASNCWNWFKTEHQQRDSGEPSIIAGIVREIIGYYDVDPGRVYVAGLSAGGAAAAVMAEVYPDLFCAAGIHSGVACGVAKDLTTALAVMKQGPRHPAPLKARSERIPVIVFHGDKDKSIHPFNMAWIVNAGKATSYGGISEVTGKSEGGVHYTKTIYRDLAGKTFIESYIVHNGQHAWFGGSSAGSSTSPNGPDASREMVRFFWEHARE